MNTWPISETERSIYIRSVDDSLDFRLPVNPESFPETNIGSWDDRDIIGVGETSFPLYPKQQSISIESFFPKVYDPTYVVVPLDEFKDPREYVSILRNIIRNSKVVHVIVTELDVDGFFTVRDFNWEEKGGEPGDIYYTLKLKGYRSSRLRSFDGTIVPTFPGAIDVLPIVKNGSGNQPNNSSSPSPSSSNSGGPVVPRDPPVSKNNSGTYTTQPCDTLRSIARKFSISELTLYVFNIAGLSAASKEYRDFFDIPDIGGKRYAYCEDAIPEDNLNVYDFPLMPGKLLRVKDETEIPVSLPPNFSQP